MGLVRAGAWLKPRAYPYDLRAYPYDQLFSQAVPYRTAYLFMVTPPGSIFVLLYVPRYGMG